jgi:phenylpyruvate tautomerase PptA (4-oxalocrotonate tautomerase family)
MMAVLSVVTFQVAPGRMEDFLAAVRTLQAIEERLAVNLTAMRLFEAEVAGDGSGQVSVVFEYADLASWGATVDRERQDAAYQDLVASAAQGDVATIVDRSLYSELPI